LDRTINSVICDWWNFSWIKESILLSLLFY